VFIMTRLVLAMIVLCSCHGTSVAGCAGKLAGVTAQSPLTYSPFAAWNAQQTLNLTVQNSGAIACGYQVSVPASYYPLQFGGKLLFNISAGAGMAPGASQFTLATPAIKPGQSLQIPILLTVPRGQPSPAGSFTSKIGFALTAAGSPAAEPPIDQVIVQLACTVPPIFEINVAGSGSRSTVQFVSLGTGQNASVVLQTRTNGSHQILFKSLNGGFMALRGYPGPASAIPYAASVDGQPIALGAPVALSYPAQPGEAARRLSITVGDTSGKLAGMYSDTIIVSILSSM
jgi:hypothetical protein